MTPNGTKPPGPIMPTAGQEAQATRQTLHSVLAGILQMKTEMNKDRLRRGEPLVPVGIRVSDESAPTILAAQAICAHLHHLTTKLEEHRQDMTLIVDELREGFGEIITTTFSVEPASPPLAAGADQELKRTAETDLEEDR